MYGLYELFVLGELMTGEKHGYMLQDVLKNALGQGRKISSGTLYPLLSRLTEQGCIQLRAEDETPGGRMKKIYRLTAAGRGRFRELMTEPLDALPDLERQQLFRFKLVYFQYVDKSVRLDCLRQYARLLEQSLLQTSQRESFLRWQKPEPEAQRVQLLRVFDHRKRLGEVELQWVKDELTRVEAERER